jgi:hypothetical protein
LPEGTEEIHVKCRMGHPNFEPGTTEGGSTPARYILLFFLPVIAAFIAYLSDIIKGLNRRKEKETNGLSSDDTLSYHPPLLSSFYDTSSD